MIFRTSFVVVARSMFLYFRDCGVGFSLDPVHDRVLLFPGFVCAKDLSEAPSRIWILRLPSGFAIRKNCQVETQAMLITVFPLHSIHAVIRLRLYTLDLAMMVTTIFRISRHQIGIYRFSVLLGYPRVFACMAVNHVNCSSILLFCWMILCCCSDASVLSFVMLMD